VEWYQAEDGDDADADADEEEEALQANFRSMLMVED
jgi:hypothetical protein